jgi:hypothetical protein
VAVGKAREPAGHAFRLDLDRAAAASHGSGAAHRT